MDRVIHGEWQPRFAPLAQSFAQAVASGEERGGLCLMQQGEVVLNLWGGSADPSGQTPWRADTLACCFSVSKGVISILAQRLMDEGLLSPDQKVTDLWPEFAAAGKGEITVEDVLTHRAGLPAVTGEVKAGDLYDPARMAALLAASAPVVAAKSAPCYHNMTFGQLMAEILCRAAGHEDFAELLEERLCRPLGAAFHFALSDAQIARCANLTREEDLIAKAAQIPDTQDIFARSMALFDPEETFNSVKWRRATIGSGSGHATAQGLARIFDTLGSHHDFLSARAKQNLGREFCRVDRDPVMGLAMRFSMGLELSSPPDLDFGPNGASMGHWGAGGATAFHNPQTGLSFGYVTGHMAAGFGSSPRARHWVEETYQALKTS